MGVTKRVVLVVGVVAMGGGAVDLVGIKPVQSDVLEELSLEDDEDGGVAGIHHCP